MLTIIIYVFAICFLQAATDHLKSEGIINEPRAWGLSEVNRQVGNLGRIVYTLAQAMLGGASWGVLSDALLIVNWTAALLFFFYIAFTILVVFNIITGSFVYKAVETAKTQRGRKKWISKKDMCRKCVVYFLKSMMMDLASLP